jgi:hypothetical protein
MRQWIVEQVVDSTHARDPCPDQVRCHFLTHVLIQEWVRSKTLRPSLNRYDVTVLVKAELEASFIRLLNSMVATASIDAAISAPRTTRRSRILQPEPPAPHLYERSLSIRNANRTCSSASCVSTRMTATT